MRNIVASVRSAAENSRADRNSFTSHALYDCVTVPVSGTEAAGQRPFEYVPNGTTCSHQTFTVWRMTIRFSAEQ